MILLIGGLAFLRFAPWVAVAVVVLLIVVVASLPPADQGLPVGRRRLRGGAPQEPRREGRPRRGVRPARRLRHDGRVSVASGVDNIISAIPELNPFRVELAVGFVIILAAVNLRGVRESSQGVRDPDLPVHRQRRRHDRRRPRPHAARRPAGRRVAELRRAGRVAHPGRPSSCCCCAPSRADAPPSPASRPISNGVPAFRRPKVRNAQRTLCSWAASRSCCSPGLTALALISQRALRREPVQPHRLDRLRDRAAAQPHRPGRRGDVRRRLDPVLRHPGGDGARAAARGEHRVQRLPAARLGARPATATRPKSLSPAATA